MTLLTSSRRLQSSCTPLSVATHQFSWMCEKSSIISTPTRGRPLSTYTDILRRQSYTSLCYRTVTTPQEKRLSSRNSTICWENDGKRLHHHACRGSPQLLHDNKPKRERLRTQLESEDKTPLERHHTKTPAKDIVVHPLLKKKVVDKLFCAANGFNLPEVC